MRTHLQGFALLGLLLAALWGAARLAAPTLSEALGEDGAVVADSGEDHIELTADSEEVDADLTTEEVQRLQFQLLRAGFLTELSDVDGYMGPETAGAIARAAEEWQLVEPTDREVLVYADELLADTPFLGET
jgi:peptidoglycan hydrolase-like protein with peptidoglycan-binding domain